MRRQTSPRVTWRSLAVCCFSLSLLPPVVGDPKFAPLIPPHFDCKIRLDVGYADTSRPMLLLLHADLERGRVREDYYYLHVDPPRKFYTCIRRFDEGRQYMAFHRVLDGPVATPQSCFVVPTEGEPPTRDFLRQNAAYVATRNVTLRIVSTLQEGVKADGGGGRTTPDGSNSSGGRSDDDDNIGVGSGGRGFAQPGAIELVVHGDGDMGGAATAAGQIRDAAPEGYSPHTLFANEWSFDFGGVPMRLFEATHTRLPLRLQMVRHTCPACLAPPSPPSEGACRWTMTFPSKCTITPCLALAWWTKSCTDDALPTGHCCPIPAPPGQREHDLPVVSAARGDQRMLPQSFWA
jgi:hypothetical protein